MNQPAQALTFDKLQIIERGTFDAIAALSSAMAYNTILGFGSQTVVGEDGQGRPVLTLIFHGDKDGDEPRQLMLSVPENGANFYALLERAGAIAMEVLNEYQQKTQRASAHFMNQQEIEKVRRNGKSKLILPKGN